MSTDQPSQDRDEIDAERERRLDPANRPEGAEVDNTGTRDEDRDDTPDDAREG